MPAPILFKSENHEFDPFLYPSQLEFRALDPVEQESLARRFDDFLPHEDEILRRQSKTCRTASKLKKLADEWYTTPTVLRRRMQYLEEH